MRVTRLLIAGLIAVGLAAMPALAAEGDNFLRFEGLYITPTDEIEMEGAEIELDNGTGLCIEYERMLTDMIGIDVSVAWSNHDVVMNGSDMTEVDVYMAPVSLNFHLTPRSKVDFFVGPVAAWVYARDDSGDTDSELGYGALAGLEIPLADRDWAFSSQAKFFSLDMDERGTNEEFPVDPAVFTVGFRYRFGG